MLPAGGAARRRHRPRLPVARSSSSPAARSATARWPPRSRPPTTTRPISMRHLVRAVAQEYGKQGRLTLEADFERFHDVIRVGNGGSANRLHPDHPTSNGGGVTSGRSDVARASAGPAGAAGQRPARDRQRERRAAAQQLPRQRRRRVRVGDRGAVGLERVLAARAAAGPGSPGTSRPAPRARTGPPARPAAPEGRRAPAACPPARRAGAPRSAPAVHGHRRRRRHEGGRRGNRRRRRHRRGRGRCVVGRRGGMRLGRRRDDRQRSGSLRRRRGLGRRRGRLVGLLGHGEVGEAAGAGRDRRDLISLGSPAADAR